MATIASGDMVGVAAVVGGVLLLARFGLPIVVSTVFRVQVVAVSDVGITLPLMGVRPSAAGFRSCESRCRGNVSSMTENTSAASNATTKSDKTAALEPDQDIRDQARKKAAELEEIYEPGARPTVVVPGTDGMVAGTAFAGMVDEQITENKPPDHPRKEDAS